MSRVARQIFGATGRVPTEATSPGGSIAELQKKKKGDVSRERPPVGECAAQSDRRRSEGVFSFETAKVLVADST